MEVVTHNATSLAWIGDAYMTLEVRKFLLEKGFRKADVLQKKSIKFNSAKSQAKILSSMIEEDFFDEDEHEILARGRNATIHSKAKNASGKEYLQATSLESLLGYLYIYHHHERLNACMNRILELGDQL